MQEIWIQCEDTRIQFPINPSEVSVSMDMGATTQKIQNWGEMSIIGKRGCRYISWNSFWPAQEYAFAMCKPAFTPQEFRSFINGNKAKLFKLTVTHTSLKGTTFIVQSFTYDNFDADGDMKYSLAFMEYRAPAYEEASQKTTEGTFEPIKQKQKETNRETTKAKPKTYAVKTGDNLWNLAYKFYGSGSKQSKLYNTNKSVIEKAAKRNGYASSSHNGVAGWWIFPGTELVIP